MPHIQKLTLSSFADFSAQVPALVDKSTPTIPEKKAPPAFTQKDIDAAFARGEQAGHLQAKAQIQQEQDGHLINLLENITTTLETAYAPINQEFYTYKKEIETATKDFLHTFIKTTSHHLTVDVVEALTRTIIDKISLDQIGIACLTLNLNPDDLEKYQTRIDKSLTVKSDTVKVKIKPDNNLSVGECYIEWEDGAIMHHYKELEQDAKSMIESIFTAHQLKHCKGRE